jgi:hypothetical protein
MVAWLHGCMVAWLHGCMVANLNLFYAKKHYFPFLRLLKFPKAAERLYFKYFLIH